MITLLYLSFLVHFQLWNYLWKPSLHQGSYFFWCSFSIKLSWWQRRSNEMNTTLYDRYYLQNCKAIIFERIANQIKYKKPDVPSHFHNFWLNFDKTNYSFLHPFCCWEIQVFERMMSGGMCNFLLPWVWWQELGGEFWMGRGMSKNASNQCIF